MQKLKRDDGSEILSWVYFHGRLQNKLGSDLVCGTVMPKSGVSFVEVEDNKDCLAFIWDEEGRTKGLITERKDRKATLDAYRKYINRVRNL